MKIDRVAYSESFSGKTIAMEARLEPEDNHSLAFDWLRGEVQAKGKGENTLSHTSESIAGYLLLDNTGVPVREYKLASELLTELKTQLESGPHPADVWKNNKHLVTKAMGKAEENGNPNAISMVQGVLDIGAKYE